MRKLQCSDKDSHEFRPILAEIEDEPANPLGRFTLWTIIAAVLFLGVWSFLGKIDVVVSARGKIEPQGGTKLIQPLETGSISAILVEEGEHVKKGQTLIEIDPSMTETNLDAKQKQLLFYELQMERLEALAEWRSFAPDPSVYDAEMIRVQKNFYDSVITAHESDVAAKTHELKSIEAEIGVSEQEKKKLSMLLSILEERQQRLDTVIDIIAQDEYDAVVSEITRHRESIAALDIKMDGLVHEKGKIAEQMGALKENLRKTALGELKDIKADAKLLGAEIKAVTIKREKQLLKSPINGYVNQVLVHTIGGVVTPAQPLISLVPEESTPQVKASILNKDIGFVRQGMPATVKLDAFDFQKYGGLASVVINVPKDSVEDKVLGDVYEVLLTLQERSLMVEGEEVTVSPGMTLTADIEVGKRRVIEFFIYPIIKYIDEGMSVR